MERMVHPSELAIDPEFRDYLPAWSTAKRAEMERQILRDGRPKVPLVVWRGTKIVVEGQNRYGICKKFGILVPIVEMEFADRNAVKAFMVEKFLGDDRDCLPQHKAVIWARHAENMKAGGVKRAAEKVAEAAGVSSRTIRRAMTYAEALDSLPDDIRERFMSGETEASQAIVKELAGYGELHQRAILSMVDSGGYSSLAAAIRGNGNEDAGEGGDGGDNDEDDDSDDEDVPFDDETDLLPAEGDTVSPSPPCPDQSSVPSPPKHAAADEPDGVQPEKSGKERRKADSKPAKPKPGRTIQEMFHDAQRDLAKVSAFLDRARGLKRSDEHYRDCIDKLKSLSDAMEDWSGC